MLSNIATTDDIKLAIVYCILLQQIKSCKRIAPLSGRLISHTNFMPLNAYAVDFHSGVCNVVFAVVKHLTAYIPDIANLFLHVVKYLAILEMFPILFSIVIKSCANNIFVHCVNHLSIFRFSPLLSLSVYYYSTFNLKCQ